MARRFRGNSIHKVDAKGRVSIPAGFRRVLEEGDEDYQPQTPNLKKGDEGWIKPPNPNLVIVYGDKDGLCLEGYSMQSISAYEDIIEGLPIDSAERDYLETVILGESVDTSVDENGRMVLSQELRDRIGLTNEATFIGKGSTFQIWEPAAYAAELDRIKGDPNSRSNARKALQNSNVGG